MPCGETAISSWMSPKCVRVGIYACLAACICILSGCTRYSRDWRLYGSLDAPGRIAFLDEAVRIGTEDDCWRAAREVRKRYYELGPGVGLVLRGLKDAKASRGPRNPKLAGDLSASIDILELAGIVSPEKAVAAPVTMATAPVFLADPGVLTMAVFDFKAGGGLSVSDASVAADWLRVALVNARRFRVIERQSMDRILAEQAFQQTGCTNQECAVKLGKVLNVSHIVLGTISRFMTSFVVSVRVVRVESGEIIYADEARGTDEDGIISGIRGIVGKMVASFPSVKP
jgi:TolB-like protein